MTCIKGILAAAVAAVTLAGTPVLAQSVKACPPGLEKKDPACIPPGQVGKSWSPDHVYAEGDRLRGDYVLIPEEDWEGLELEPITDASVYVLIDGQILRIDRNSLRVVEAVRIVADTDDGTDGTDDGTDGTDDGTDGDANN